MANKLRNDKNTNFLSFLIKLGNFYNLVKETSSADDENEITKQIISFCDKQRKEKPENSDFIGVSSL